MRAFRRILRSYAVAIGSFSVFLALPGLAIGIFTGGVLALVAGYVAMYVVVSLGFALLLAPLLPLLAQATVSDWRAKIATLLLVPPYCLLMSSIASAFGVSLRSLSRWNNLDLSDFALLYLALPAAIMLMSFFAFDGDAQKREQTSQ